MRDDIKEHLRTAREAELAARSEELASSANALLDQPTEALLRSELGSRSFDGLRHDFEGMRDALRVVADAAGTVAPAVALDEVASLLHRIREIFDEVAAFNVLDSDSAHRRNRIDRLVDEYRRTRDASLASLALLKSDVRSIELLQRQHAENLMTLSTDAHSMAEELRQQLSQSSDLIGTLRESLQRTSISTHAKVFADEALAAEQSATKWLWATAVLAVMLIGVVGLHLWAAIKSIAPTMEMVVQQSIAKLIAYSLLLSAIVWTGRNYRVAQHNRIVNQHRANALRCFEALSESTSDPDVRHTILRQATQSIFAPQSTGFVETEREDSGATQVLEVFGRASAAARQA